MRNDDYYWLRDDKRQNPEMLAYLNAENSYADAVMQPLRALQDLHRRGRRREIVGVHPERRKLQRVRRAHRQCGAQRHARRGEACRTSRR